MKPFILAVALGTAVFGILPLEGCAAKPLQLAASFSPNPPKTGIERITIVLTDASNSPVDGAVLTVASSMPSMSMSGPSVLATAEGNGRYVASLNLAFATRWVFVVSARRDGATARKTIPEDVR